VITNVLQVSAGRRQPAADAPPRNDRDEQQKGKSRTAGFVIASFCGHGAATSAARVAVFCRIRVSAFQAARESM